MDTNKIIEIPIAKRIFDIFFVIILFIIFLPFCLFILIWIVIERIFFQDSRGPFFYKEIRISQGREFEFYKWRIFKVTAIEKAKAKGVVHTAGLQSDKNNMTYYGRFLQKIYMDEIPQLWNILKGEMTLVGPRPTNTEVSAQRLAEGDNAREIFVCGLTGPFQAEKGHAGFDQTQMDREYLVFIASAPPWWKIIIKDLSILLKTVKVIAEAKGI